MIMIMATTIITATPTMTTDQLHLLRLQAWLSPAFPIGGFSYSHGLEQAAALGWVHDRETLVDWLDTDLRYGAGRTDAILLAAAYRAVGHGIVEVAELAAALRGTSELALESATQGISFLATIRKAWPHRQLEDLHRLLAANHVTPTFPVVVGAACAAHGIPLPLALQFTLHAVVANYVNASLRLMKMGQTDGQHAIAALEDAVMETVQEALDSSLDDIGSASLSVDIASMRHETQYSRLFRS
jgi:urease accessory protein